MLIKIATLGYADAKCYNLQNVYKFTCPLFCHTLTFDLLLQSLSLVVYVNQDA